MLLLMSINFKIKPHYSLAHKLRHGGYMLLLSHSVFRTHFLLSTKPLLTFSAYKKALLLSACILVSNHSTAAIPSDLKALLQLKTTTFLNADFNSEYPLAIKQRENPIAFEHTTLTGKNYLSFFKGDIEEARTLLSDAENIMLSANKQVLIDCNGANGDCGFYTIREFMRAPERKEIFERYDANFFNLNHHNYQLKLSKVIMGDQHFTQMTLLLINTAENTAIAVIDTTEEISLDNNNTANKGYALLGTQLPYTKRKTIHFANNSYAISADQSTLIKSFADTIKASNNGKFSIVGHTDDSGSEQQNLLLAQLRAQAVYDRLITQYGIPKEHLEIISAGGSKPIASNKDESGRILNRRTELIQQEPTASQAL
jgi:outer membrane protein OmpA-like peptidoglycan-associated protein